MANNRIELIRSRKDFYRDHYTRVCIGLLIALVIIFLLCGIDIYLLLFRPIPDFYAAAMDGKITQLFPLRT